MVLKRASSMLLDLSQNQLDVFILKLLGSLTRDVNISCLQNKVVMGDLKAVFTGHEHCFTFLI